MSYHRQQLKREYQQFSNLVIRINQYLTTLFSNLDKTTLSTNHFSNLKVHIK